MNKGPAQTALWFPPLFQEASPAHSLPSSPHLPLLSPAQPSREVQARLAPKLQMKQGRSQAVSLLLPSAGDKHHQSTFPDTLEPPRPALLPSTSQHHTAGPGAPQAAPLHTHSVPCSAPGTHHVLHSLPPAQHVRAGLSSHSCSPCPCCPQPPNWRCCSAERGGCGAWGHGGTQQGRAGQAGVRYVHLIRVSMEQC